MQKSFGGRRPKNVGVIGMGRGDLARGGGITLKKPLPSMVIQEKNDKVSIKSLKSDKSQAGFAFRARKAKSEKKDEKPHD